MYRRKIEDELFTSKPVEMPSETMGECNRCGKLKELGDGFCIECWDKGSNKNKVYKQPKRKKKKGKIGRPRTVNI